MVDPAFKEKVKNLLDDIYKEYKMGYSYRGDPLFVSECNLSIVDFHISVKNHPAHKRTRLHAGSIRFLTNYIPFFIAKPYMP